MRVARRHLQDAARDEPAALPARQACTGSRSLVLASGWPSRSRSWRLLARRGRPDQRQPDAAGHRLDRGDRPARPELPKQPNGTVPIVLDTQVGQARRSSQTRRSVEATVASLENAATSTNAVEPALVAGAGQPSARTADRLLALTLDLGPGDLDADEANAIIDAAEPAGGRRDRGRGGRLSRSGGLQAVDPTSSEAIGIVRRGDHPAARLRHRGGDVAADLDRDPRLARRPQR